MYIGRTLTGRLRLNCSFCQACNYPFQGLAAEGAKIALYYLWRERFAVVNFVHDETITEIRDDDHLQANIKKINELMIAGMRQVVTHVPIGVEGALMRRWRKEAKPVFDSNGNLLVWEDVRCFDPTKSQSAK